MGEKTLVKCKEVVPVQAVVKVVLEGGREGVVIRMGT